jgi:4-carboxymuconolactone decarboxylase
MDRSELAERGLRLRQEMFGEKFVKERLDAFGEFGSPLQEFINAYAYGDLWQRPGLSNATKSLVIVAMMAATSRAGELAVHLRGALKNGVSPEEIREALLLLAVYCGVPAANEAFRVATEVLEKESRLK